MRDTQRKGDIAVAQAISTFTKMGYDVSLPMTESAAYDLVVDFKNSLKRIQVKYSSNGKEIGLRRIHSNSKGYVIKRLLQDSFDWLYILDGKGEEFLVVHPFMNRSTITPRQEHSIKRVFIELETIA